MASQETAQQTTLRGLIGETIPKDGTEDDTMVTEDQLQAWLDSEETMDAAALAGWKFKVAEWAGLVTVTDGAASRQFSDLLDHGNAMIKLYSNLAAGPAYGRTRVGKIVRS